MRASGRYVRLAFSSRSPRPAMRRSDSRHAVCRWPVRGARPQPRRHDGHVAVSTSVEALTDRSVHLRRSACPRRLRPGTLTDAARLAGSRCSGPTLLRLDRGRDSCVLSGPLARCIDRLISCGSGGQVGQRSPAPRVRDLAPPLDSRAAAVDQPGDTFDRATARTPARAERRSGSPRG